MEGAVNVLRFWPLALFGFLAALVGGVGFLAVNPDAVSDLPIWDVDIEHRHHDIYANEAVTYCAVGPEITNEAPPLPCDSASNAIACAGCCNAKGECCCGEKCECPTCSCKPEAKLTAAPSQCGPGGCTAPFSVFPGPATVDHAGPPGACGPDGCHAPIVVADSLAPPPVNAPPCPAPVAPPAHFAETHLPPEAVALIMEARVAEAIAREKLKSQRKIAELISEFTSEHFEVVAENERLKASVALMEERFEEYSEVMEIVAEKVQLETKIEALESTFEVYSEMLEGQTEAAVQQAEMQNRIAVLETQLEQAQSAAQTNEQLQEQVAQLEHLLHENDILRTHIGVLEEELFQNDIIKSALKECPEPKPAVQR